MDGNGELLSILKLLEDAPEEPSRPAGQPASPGMTEGGLVRLLQAGFSAFGDGSDRDDRARLLLALGPFLSPARARRIRTAIHIMHAADVLSAAIYGEGGSHERRSDPSDG